MSLQVRASRDLLFGLVAEQVDDLANIQDEIDQLEPGANRIEVKLKLMDHKGRITRQAHNLIGMGGADEQEDKLLEEAEEVR